MMDSPGLTLALELLDKVRRNWWTVVAALFLGLAGAHVVLVYMPKIYLAETKIYVAAPKISEQLVPSTVTEDLSTRMKAMESVVLSRPYMIRLIEKSFGPQESSAAEERLIDGIRHNTQVKYSLEDGIFTIGYMDTDADRSAEVVNSLAKMFMEENRDVRTAMAKDATDTMRKMADEAFLELRKKQDEISTFESQHLFETMEYMDSNNHLLEARQTALATLNDDVEQVRYDIRTLQDQQNTPVLLPESSLSSSTPVSDVATRLSLLEAELKNLRSQYSDEHPDVQAKMREFDDLKKQYEGQQGAVSDGQQSSDDGSNKVVAKPLSAVEIAIQSKKLELDRMLRERTRLQGDIRLYERRIEATPAVEKKLRDMKKGITALEETYEKYTRNVQEAEGSQLIEESKKGTQFEVIAPAFSPRIPLKPDPMLVFLLGAAAGFMVFVGPLLASAFLRPVVMSESGVRTVLEDVPLLVTIPRLDTPDAAVGRRKRITLNFGLAVVAIGGSGALWFLIG